MLELRVILFYRESIRRVRSLTTIKQISYQLLISSVSGSELDDAVYKKLLCSRSYYVTDAPGLRANESHLT